MALRPRLIWGPGDTQLLPRLVDRAVAGRLRFIGDGDNRMDTTYIDNAVDAHLRALDALQPAARLRRPRLLHQQRRAADRARDRQRPAARGGRAGGGRDASRIRLAYAVGGVLELAWKVLRAGRASRR